MWQLLVCIDESGCTGFKLDSGSSAYFVIAMVIFTDFKEAEKCSQAIQDLKDCLKIKAEFKFNKSHANVKESFFLTVKKFDFIIRAIVVDKNAIFSSRLRSRKSHFYRYIMKLLMQGDGNLLK